MNFFFLLVITFIFEIGTVVMGLLCYKYCINPYKEYNGLEGDECNELKERNVVDCQGDWWYNTWPTCYLEIIGETVVFGCTNRWSKIERCKREEGEGLSLCYHCGEDYCNSKEKALEIAEKSHPRGAAKCYDAKGESTICEHHISNYYECISLVEERENNTLHITKQCVKTKSEDEDVKALVKKCAKNKDSCYLCNTDLCNYHDRGSDIGGRTESGSNHLTATSNLLLFSLFVVMNVLCDNVRN